MMCICCDSKVELLKVNKEELNEEEEVFRKEIKINPTTKSNYIVHAGQNMWGDGVVDMVSAGYGSTLDGNQYIIAVCDNCLRKKTMTGHIAYIGDYMTTLDVTEEEYYKNARTAWRRYNNIDNLLKK